MSVTTIHTLSFVVTAAVIFLGFRWHFRKEAKRIARTSWEDLMIVADIKTVRALFLASRHEMNRRGAN